MTARFSFAPLAAKAPATSPTSLARALKVSTAMLRRYAADGLDAWQADRCAVRLGFHPAEVWPDWSAEILDDDQVPDLPRRTGIRWHRGAWELRVTVDGRRIHRRHHAPHDAEGLRSAEAAIEALASAVEPLRAA